MSNATILTAVAVVGLLITAATVWGSFRVSRNTQATTLYRETASAWEAKSTAQDDEIASLKRALVTKDTQIAELNARVSLLTDMVTGKSVLEEVRQRFDERTDELLGIVSTTRDEVARMRKALDAPRPAA